MAPYAVRVGRHMRTENPCVLQGKPLFHFKTDLRPLRGNCCAGRQRDSRPAGRSAGKLRFRTVSGNRCLLVGKPRFPGITMMETLAS